jgi:hypothetical protein
MNPMTLRLSRRGIKSRPSEAFAPSTTTSQEREMKRKLPGHMPGTIKQWRIKKRRELDEVIKAMRTFRLGCAYTPTNDWGDLLSAVEKNRRRLSVKEWK